MAENLQVTSLTEEKTTAPSFQMAGVMCCVDALSTRDQRLSDCMVSVTQPHLQTNWSSCARATVIQDD